jgi:hypothetical protein
MRKNVSAALVGSLLLVLFTGCTHSSQIRQTAAPQEPATDPAIVAEAALSSPLVFVIYGDMRFTDPSEMVASEPAARHALVVKIAAERPDALFLTGDVPWHGGTTDDYRVYHDETAVWRERRLRVYPALGNHEFQGSAPRMFTTTSASSGTAWSTSCQAVEAPSRPPSRDPTRTSIRTTNFPTSTTCASRWRGSVCGVKWSGLQTTMRLRPGCGLSKIGLSFRGGRQSAEQ